MARKKNETAFAIYTPIVLIAAFLLGCFSMALLGMRENVGGITYAGRISGSDADGRGQIIRKSAVIDDSGLKYRMVSASDLEIKKPEKDKAISSETLSSDVSSEEEAVSSEVVSSEVPSSEDEVSSDESEVSSEPSIEDVSSEEEEPVHLELPNDLYINFTPVKKDRVCYITFDDGPSEYTEDILDILDYYGAKATFFVIYHKDMADKYKAIVDRGHSIGLHTYSHKYEKIYRSETAFFNEIDRIQTYVKNVTGVRSKIIRFPGGSSNSISRHYGEDIMAKLTSAAGRKGFVYHDWNVDSGDAEGYNIDPDKLLENVKKNLTWYKKPDILMHDAGESKRTTVEALPSIIEYIYSKGYSCEGLKLDSYAVHH